MNLILAMGESLEWWNLTAERKPRGWLVQHLCLAEGAGGAELESRERVARPPLTAELRPGPWSPDSPGSLPGNRLSCWDLLLAQRYSLVESWKNKSNKSAVVCLKWQHKYFWRIIIFFYLQFLTIRYKGPIGRKFSEASCDAKNFLLKLYMIT